MQSIWASWDLLLLPALHSYHGNLSTGRGCYSPAAPCGWNHFLEAPAAGEVRSRDPLGVPMPRGVWNLLVGVGVETGS